VLGGPARTLLFRREAPRPQDNELARTRIIRSRTGAEGCLLRAQLVPEGGWHRQTQGPECRRVCLQRTEHPTAGLPDRRSGSARVAQLCERIPGVDHITEKLRERHPDPRLHHTSRPLAPRSRSGGTPASTDPATLRAGAGRPRRVLQIDPSVKATAGFSDPTGNHLPSLRTTSQPGAKSPRGHAPQDSNRRRQSRRIYRTARNTAGRKHSAPGTRRVGCRAGDVGLGQVDLDETGLAVRMQR